MTEHFYIFTEKLFGGGSEYVPFLLNCSFLIFFLIVWLYWLQWMINSTLHQKSKG